MLLIEGPDMAGKTTLAIALVAALAKMGKPSAYMKFGMESRGKMTFDYLKQRISRWTVCDRMHWSESIYAVGTKMEPSLSAYEFVKTNRAIAEIGGMIIVITCEPNGYRDVIVPKHHGRGEDFDRETCCLVNWLYRDALKNCAIQCSGGSIAKYNGDDPPVYAFEVMVDAEGEAWRCPDSFVAEMAAEYALRQERAWVERVRA